ncbi:hypothetical protein ACFLUU_10935, partial [Chloroflexota bacterium]
NYDGYNVYRSLTSGSGYSKVNGSLVATSAYTDTGLTASTTYYYVVTAVDFGSNESGYSTEASATPTDPPPAVPTGLVAMPSDAEVGLDWNDNGESDLDGYNVYRSLSSGSGYSKINGSLLATSNYTDTTVTNDTTYYYVVTAVDVTSSESSYSSEDSATPDATPAAPTGLAATSGDKQVSLNWNDNSEGDIDGYNVYRSLTSGSGYSKVNGSLVATSNYTNTGLPGGVTYYYVVTAVDMIANESGYSNEDSATPTDLTPAVPTGLAATPGDKQVSLNWNNNTEDDLDGYNVYRSLTSGSGYAKINGSLLSTSDYTDTGLTGGTTYYYVVTAVDLIANESGYSTEDSATATDPPPAAPTGLVATPSDAEVSLDWNNNGGSDLDGYNVYRSLTSGSGYAKINGSLLATSNYTDTTVTNDTTYYYVVTAVDSGSNESGYSTEDSATPDATPAAPTGLAATPGDRQVSLDWDDNSEGDIDGYNVYRSLTSGSGYTKINSSLVELSTYTDTTLTNGTTYYYVVTAVDLIANESGYSSEDSATPTGLTLIDDGFEGSTWNANWDGNGTTAWTRDSALSHTDSYSAKAGSGGGSLTSDDLDASTAYNLAVAFWFYPKGLETGDVIVEIYDGSTYNTLYDLRSYPTHTNLSWCYFSETITDSQYFISNFRIRFSTSLVGAQESINIDDVLIKTNQ